MAARHSHCNTKLNQILIFHALDGHRNIVEMYWEIEQKCCLYTKLMLYYIYGHQMPVLGALAHAVYCICTGDSNTSAWDLPFNVIVPFETQSVRGWLLKWLFEVGTGFVYILCIIIPTSYFFSFCLYIVAICSHFDLLTDEIRMDIDEAQNGTLHRQHHANLWHRVRKKITHLIAIHVNALQ